MKNRIKKIALMSLSAAFSIGSINAQQPDTIRVKETKQTIITHDSVTIKSKKTPVVADTVAKVTPAVQEQREPEPRFHNLEAGLRFMPTFSSLSVRTYNGEVIKGEASVSGGYGVMFGVNFTRHIGVMGEINYLKTSQKYKDGGLDRVVDVNYINIPVLLSLNTNKSSKVNWNVVLGPQFGLNVGAGTSSAGSSGTVTAVVGVKKGDVGVAYGTGLEVMVNKMRTIRIDFGFRGFYGLVNMNDENTDGNTNTYNVLVKASRKAYGGYLGLSFLF